MKDFNGLVTELNSNYFPQIKYWHDNKKTHRNCELFNNDYLSLQQIIKRLTKTVKEIKALNKSIKN